MAHYALPPGIFERLKDHGDSLLQNMGDWTAKGVKDGMELFFKKDPTGGPTFVAGVGIFAGVTVTEAVREMVTLMPQNSAAWDTTVQHVETLHRWSEQDFLYQYIFKAPVLSQRDMVYYEGVRTAADGCVTNVSSSVPGFDAAVPLPPHRVRSTLHLHFKRYEPVDGGRSCRYTTIQQIDIGGWLPNALAFSGVLDGLRKEFVGYKEIIARSQAKGAS